MKEKHTKGQARQPEKPAAEAEREKPKPEVEAETSSGQQPPAQAELAALQAESADLLARLQRLSAEYLNYQKRVAREIDEAREFANSGLMKDLLPVVDDLERALSSAELAQVQRGAESRQPEAADALIEGVRLVLRKLTEALGRYGLKRIECVGMPFDPLRHQALLQEPSSAHAVPTVLRELQTGYELRGRLLRPCSVVVSTPDNPQSPAAADEPEEVS